MQQRHSPYNLAGEGTYGSGSRSIFAGWGAAQVAATPFGRQLEVDGQRHAHGLGVLGNSQLEVSNRSFRRFSITVGVEIPPPTRSGR